MGKLSKFKKMIGNLGKRLFNWKQEKYPINILSVMMEAVIKEYATMYDGDYKHAVRVLEQFLSPAGEQLVSSLLLEPAVLGMAFKAFMTDDLEDLPWLTATSLWAIFGKKGYRTLFGKEGVRLLSAEESEEGIPTLIIAFQKCPFCCNIDITQEDLNNESYGKMPEILFGEMIGCIQEFVGNDYKCYCRETKCFLRGDDVGEYRIWLYPTDELDKITSNPFLKNVEVPSAYEEKISEDELEVKSENQEDLSDETINE